MSTDNNEPASRPRRPPPRKLQQWESAVDRQIREAQERGEFDRLPGYGKPLPVESWQGDWALAHHLLKQAGETLPWIDLGRQIEAGRARLDELLRDAATITDPGERSRARDRYLREAAELDKRMQEYAFTIPSRQLDRGRLPPHVAAAQFDAACPRR